MQLLRANRWAALASARDNEPLCSWVAVVPEPRPGDFLLHLSSLALHTRYLLANPQASLAFSEPDAPGGGDPQALARVSLQGKVGRVAREAPEYGEARARYLGRFPHAAQTFDFADFDLVRFRAESARYVPGLGRVHRLNREALLALAAAREN